MSRFILSIYGIIISLHFFPQHYIDPPTYQFNLLPINLSISSICPLNLGIIIIIISIITAVINHHLATLFYFNLNLTYKHSTHHVCVFGREEEEILVERVKKICIEQTDTGEKKKKKKSFTLPPFAQKAEALNRERQEERKLKTRRNKYKGDYY